MEKLNEQQEMFEQQPVKVDEPSSEQTDVNKAPHLLPDVEFYHYSKLSKQSTPKSNNDESLAFILGMLFGVPTGMLLSIPVSRIYYSTALSTLPSALIWAVGFYSIRSMTNYIFKKFSVSTGFVYEALWIGILMYSIEFDYMALVKTSIQRV